MSEENLSRSPTRVDSDEEAEIAALAYRFYCEEGYPKGKAHEHWSRAAREVRAKAEPVDLETPKGPAASARAENPPLEE